jgi:hypothetical protein
MQLLFDIRFVGDVLGGRLDVAQHVQQAVVLEQAVRILTDSNAAANSTAAVLASLSLHDMNQSVADDIAQLIRRVKDRVCTMMTAKCCGSTIENRFG